MQRICNLKAMSNGQGPAAEGVAHKIIQKLATFQNSPNVILCFVIAIGTISANIHSLFFTEIGLISMIWEISSADLRFLFVPVFSTINSHFEVQICRHNCFKDVYIYFLICFRVTWYIKMFELGFPGGRKSINHESVRFWSLT